MRNLNVEFGWINIRTHRLFSLAKHTKHVLTAISSESEYGIVSSQYGAPGVPPSRCRCHLDDGLDENIASVYVFFLRIIKEMQKGYDAPVSAVHSRGRRFVTGRLVVGSEPGYSHTMVARTCFTGMTI